MDNIAPIVRGFYTILPLPEIKVLASGYYYFSLHHPPVRRSSTTKESSDPLTPFKSIHFELKSLTIAISHSLDI